jgi:hypothetical protein
MAAAKKARTVEFEGVQHTDRGLAAMKTGEVAALVGRMRGDQKAPKPATKARAIELFWKAAQEIPENKEKPKAKAKSREATSEPRTSEKGAPEKAPRRAKLYSIAEGAEVAESVTPQARALVASMAAAGRPLAMAECAALLQTKKAGARPDKIVAWYFAKVLRPAGILVEAREGRSA